MTKHITATHEQWLTARLELLEAEKELTRPSDEPARRRQELPWVQIDRKYRFETDEGSALLADLFQGRSQRLVYHFMFGPDYTAGCPSCSTHGFQSSFSVSLRRRLGAAFHRQRDGNDRLVRLHIGDGSDADARRPEDVDGVDVDARTGMVRRPGVVPRHVVRDVGSAA